MTKEIKTIIVYHDNETLARRSRRPRAGETIAYRSIKDWDEKENAKFDEVVDKSTPKPAPAKKSAETQGKAET